MEDASKNKANWPGWDTVRLLGQGSFGAVYEIERDVLGEKEKAALKVISIPQSSSEIDEFHDEGYDDESITESFREQLKSVVAEYSLMRKLNGSANVVNCDDLRYVQHDDGLGWDIYIRMELLTPLADALPAEISEEQVIEIAKDLCSALVQCGKYSIVHRDIKPQNIFVSPLGDYKLGDFGIARTMERTTGGTKTGTFKYMAPEVYHSEPYGAGADIYSLGLVLYWLLNERRMPFVPLPPERIRSWMEEEARQRRFGGEQIPPPAHGSRELKRIVLKACEYDPKKRYHCAEDMLCEIEALSLKNRENRRTDQYSEDLGGLNANLKKTADPGPDFGKTEIRDHEEGSHSGPEEAEPGKRKRSDDIRVPGKKREKNKEAKRRATKKWLLVFTAVSLVLLLVIGSVIIMKGIAGGRARNGKASVRLQEELLNSPWAASVLDAGSYHTVCLLPEGRIASAGDNEYGQCDVAGWEDITDIAAGDSLTVGLRRNGTVVAAGLDQSGSCETDEWTDITAVSAGGGHTLGLRRDGTVVSAGMNDCGQCDVSEWTDIMEVAAGLNFTAGLRKDGTVVAAGDNSFGQCNVSGWNDIIAIAAGDLHTIGLRRDGTVVAVGHNEQGQCDLSSWKEIVAVSGGAYHTVALKSDGTAVACGYNGHGESDVGRWTDIVAITAGAFHTVGLRSDGTVVAVGNNERGQCDLDLRNRQDLSASGNDAQPGQPDIPKDAVFAEEDGVLHYFYLYEVESSYSWDDAERFCEALGGHLATLTSKAQNDAAYEAMKKRSVTSSVYFGLSDKNKEGVWTWATGEIGSYSNWQPGEPDGGKEENYGAFYYNVDAACWIDADFKENGRKPIICEWDIQQ